MSIIKIYKNLLRQAGVLSLLTIISFSALASDDLKSIVDVAKIDLKRTLSQAQNGDPESQTNLGMRYTYGYGVNKDYSKAFRWFKKAADQNYPEAQYHIGVMYSYGESITKDQAKAAKWYEKSANQGFTAAQNNLGLFYAQGIGVPKDGIQALKWFTAAANQDFGDSQYSLGVMYNTGDGVVENKAIAKKYFAQGCKNRNKSSCNAFLKLGQIIE